MNTEEIEARVLNVFLGVAPDVDPAELKRDTPFRQQFDFDSMDVLNFAIGLHAAFDIEVPETAYRELASLHGAVEYVRRTMSRASS